MLKNTIIRIIILVVTITFTFPIIGNHDTSTKTHKLTSKEITVNWCSDHSNDFNQYRIIVLYWLLLRMPSYDSMYIYNHMRL